MDSPCSIDSLALETIQAIFCYLSQPDIATCASVNRGWSIATRDLLYGSIQLYDLTQIHRLIKAAHPPLTSVHSITFHCHVQDTETWTGLQRLCPKVKQVRILPDQHPGLYGVCCHRRRYPLAEGWPQLTHLPVWHKDSSSVWIPLLAPQLTSLAMDLYFYDSLDLPLLQHLTRLELYASRGFFRLDERSFARIHAACPGLLSLALTSFQLSLGNLSFGDSSYPLSSLTLDHVCLVDATGYTWLGQTYPELQTLRLVHVRVTTPTEEASVSALVRLITHQCPRLTCLEVEPDSQEEEGDRSSLLSGLNQWLTSSIKNKKKKKVTLDRFHWTFRVLEKKIPLVESDTPLFSSFSFLTSLNLTLGSWPLGNNIIQLPRLECLKLEFTIPTSLSFPLLIATCPNLTRLNLSGATLTTNDGDDDTSFVDPLPSTPKLKEWTISDTKIRLDSDIACICKQCPRLQRLTLSHLRCQLDINDTVPAKEAGQRFVLGLNLGTIQLDYLSLSNLWYESMMMADPRYTKRVAVQQIHVHQLVGSTATKSCCEDRVGDLWENKVQVHVTCRSIDRIRLSQTKYC